MQLPPINDGLDDLKQVIREINHNNDLISRELFKVVEEDTTTQFIPSIGKFHPLEGDSTFPFSATYVKLGLIDDEDAPNGSVYTPNGSTYYIKAENGNSYAIVDTTETTIVDHGSLTGLSDDDHPQYFTVTRGDGRYAMVGHSHSDLYYTKSEINNLLEGTGYISPWATVPGGISRDVDNVGIGTNALNYRLTVDGKSDSAIVGISTDNVGETAYLKCINSSDNDLIILSHSGANGDGQIELARSDGLVTLNLNAIGTSTIPTLIVTNISINNDGSGSNIDADMLDGQHGSYYENYWTLSGSDVYRSSGNVGIGTTSPIEAINVKGDDKKIRLENGSGVASAVISHSLAGTGGNFSIYNDSGVVKSLIRGYSISGAQGYFTAGNIGFGTDTPDALITVKGGTLGASDWISIKNTIDEDILKLYLNSSGGGIIDLLESDGSTVGIRLDVDSDSYINSGGKFGIGTSAPLEKLTVGGDGETIAVRKSDDTLVVKTGHATSNGGYLQINDNAGSISALIRGYTVSNVQAYFMSGNIGIGTTSPSTKLEINGELSYTSDPTWTQLGTTGVYYTKRGGIVFLKGFNTRSTSTTSFGTLPAGYRPSSASFFPAITSDPVPVAGSWEIGTNGVIEFVRYDATTRSYHAAVISFIAEN